MQNLQKTSKIPEQSSGGVGFQQIQRYVEERAEYVRKTCIEPLKREYEKNRKLSDHKFEQIKKQPNFMVCLTPPKV